MRKPHGGMERRAAICNKKSGYRTRLTGKSVKKSISPVFPGRLHCTGRYDSVCTFRDYVTYIFVFYGIYRPSYRTGIFLLFLRDRDYRLPDFIVPAPTGSIAGTFVLCHCHCPDAVQSMGARGHGNPDYCRALPYRELPEPGICFRRFSAVKYSVFHTIRTFHLQGRHAWTQRNGTSDSSGGNKHTVAVTLKRSEEGQGEGNGQIYRA